MVFIVLSAAVLLFLNIYISKTCKQIFSRGEEAAIRAQVLTAATALGEAESPDAAKDILEELRASQVLLTDANGNILYASQPDTTGTSALPEVTQALRGESAVTIAYRSGVVVSRAAAPILRDGALTGCVYLQEQDAEQGRLIRALKQRTLTITVLLELAVIAFTLLYSRNYTGRLRKIMDSIGIIRDGNYDHKVELGGHDELTVLGSEFNALTDKLQASEALQRQFISDASHELKTPLASIKLLSDSILQNDMDPDTLREFVADIGDEADRLTRMSEKLLSLTQFHPDVGSDCEITYLGPTIDRVVRMLSTIADMACVTLETDIVTDSSILILEDDLYQIIFNLVENGIKYNVPDGTLTVRLTRQEDNAILTISDTGMGIPAESLDKIFDRFYRVDKARSRQTGGSGLGLAIVRDMVQRNRGSISVVSSDAPPAGTTFTLVFPVFDVDL